MVLLTICTTGSSFSAERVKAGLSDLTSVYLFNFIRFTDWPDAAPEQDKAGRVVNILHDQKVYDSFKGILSRPVGKNLGLELQSCKKTSCIENSSVLYIGESDRGHFSQLLKLVETRPVLTISDTPGFAEQGGMIEMKHHNEKLTFVVNLQAVRRAGLYISAQLLQLGEIVGRDNE